MRAVFGVAFAALLVSACASKAGDLALGGDGEIAGLVPFLTNPVRRPVGDQCLIEIHPDNTRDTPPITDAANLPLFHARVEGQLPAAVQREWGVARVLSESSSLFGQRIFILGNVAGSTEVDDWAESFILVPADGSELDPNVSPPPMTGAGYGRIQVVGCPAGTLRGATQ